MVERYHKVALRLLLGGLVQHHINFIGAELRILKCWLLI